VTFKVHLDTDIGGDIDDLCALAMLLKWPGVELTGVTTVAEHDGKRAGYVHDILRRADRADVPVAAGADIRLGHLKLGADLPPEDQYWPETVPPAPGPIEAALDLLERSVELGATIVGIGPYTNLSLLERRRPGVLRNAQVVLMGGSIHAVPPGFPPWSIESDYNVQADPAATVHVLEATAATLVPIEITAQTALRRGHVSALAGGDAVARLIALQAEAFAREWQNDTRYGERYRGVPDDTINFQHDPLACAVAVGWNGVVVQEVPLAVETSGRWLRLRTDPAGRRHRVVTAVDGEGFNACWLRVVSLPASSTQG
jgi:purine nucleosidase